MSMFRTLQVALVDFDDQITKIYQSLSVYTESFFVYFILIAIAIIPISIVGNSVKLH